MKERNVYFEVWVTDEIKKSSSHLTGQFKQLSLLDP